MAQDKYGRDQEIDKLFLAALNAASAEFKFQVVAGDPENKANGWSNTELYADRDGRLDRVGSYSTYEDKQHYLVEFPSQNVPAELRWNRIGTRLYLTIIISSRYHTDQSNAANSNELAQTPELKEIIKCFYGRLNK